MPLARWTDDELGKLTEMLGEGKTQLEISRALKCTLNRVKGRVRWETKTDEQRQRRRETIRAWQRRNKGKTYIAHPSGNCADRASSRPSPELIEEARRRADAPRSLSAIMLGDPPLGYSALDRKNEACA